MVEDEEALVFVDLAFNRGLFARDLVCQLWTVLLDTRPELCAGAFVFDHDDETLGRPIHDGNALFELIAAEEPGSVRVQRSGVAVRQGGTVQFGTRDASITVYLDVWSDVTRPAFGGTRWSNELRVEWAVPRARIEAVRAAFVSLCEELQPVLASCCTQDEAELDALSSRGRRSPARLATKPCTPEAL